MIEASFDRLSRRAAIDGAYQYDTGQRLRLSGLPSPDELAEEDDFLTGDMVTVQAHYGYDGDPQTESRLVQWDEDRFCWMSEIPDEYLTRNEPVNVYVYVYHGETEDETRAHTAYEGVFIPKYRPAPNNVASDDMLKQWAELEAEVDLVLSTMSAALENAATYTQNANEAAESANAAVEPTQAAAAEADKQTARLEANEALWDGATVRRVDLSESASPSVAMEDGMLTYYLPAGPTGAQGDQGAAGPTDITLDFTDGVLTITPK